MRSYLLKCALLCLALTVVAAHALPLTPFPDRAGIITFTVDADGESGTYYYDTTGPNDGQLDSRLGTNQLANYFDGVGYISSSGFWYSFGLENPASNAGVNAYFQTHVWTFDFRGEVDLGSRSYFKGDQLWTGSVTAPVFINGIYALNAAPELGYTDSGTVTISGALDVAVTPEPSSLVLLGTGLVGMAGLARRRFRRI